MDIEKFLLHQLLGVEFLSLWAHYVTAPDYLNQHLLVNLNDSLLVRANITINLSAVATVRSLLRMRLLRDYKIW
jgi:hypothetical protein